MSDRLEKKKVDWYSESENKLHQEFEKKATNKMWQNPHAFDLFSCPDTTKMPKNIKNFFENKNKKNVR